MLLRRVASLRYIREPGRQVNRQTDKQTLAAFNVIPTTGDTLTVVFDMFVHIIFSRENLIDGSQKGLQRQNQHQQLCDLWLNGNPVLSITAHVYIDLFHYLSIRAAQLIESNK